jgi:hypothetical protein
MRANKAIYGPPGGMRKSGDWQALLVWVEELREDPCNPAATYGDLYYVTRLGDAKMPSLKEAALSCRRKSKLPYGFVWPLVQTEPSLPASSNVVRQPHLTPHHHWKLQASYSFKATHCQAPNDLEMPIFATSRGGLYGLLADLSRWLSKVILRV